MAECGRNLGQTPEYPSDAILAQLVGLRRLDDQIHESFYTEDTIDIPLNDPRILMNFKFMETQIEDSQDYGCSSELRRGNRNFDH